MKIILLANTDWYLYNYRLALAGTLRGQGNDVLLLSPDGPYAPLIQRAGFRWMLVHLSRRGINPFIELSAIWQIWRLYRREKPDLVHHFTIKCVLYGSTAAHLAGVKCIINAITGLGYLFSYHNFFTKIARPMVRALYKLLLKHTRVIFQNQNHLEYFIHNRLVSADHAVIIPGSGVDMSVYRPPKGKREDGLVVLPARMLWDKGVGEFVSAAELVRKAGNRARFALVGDVDVGNPASIPAERLRQWQESGLVEWWGWRNEMISIYQKASIVCLPSYGEGLAKSLIEAAACGCPLIASDIPGCREVVRDGENGVLVPPKESRSLAEALLRLLSDTPLRKQMEKASRKLAETEFSIEKVNRQTILVYNSVTLGNGTAHTP